MIEVVAIECEHSPEELAYEIQKLINDGFDLISTHVTAAKGSDDNMLRMWYTAFLSRGSRPGQANKASQIEILENEIKALKAIAEANSLAIKAVDSRLDATIKDFNAGWDDEAITNEQLDKYVDDLRLLNEYRRRNNPVILLDDIPVRSAYEDAVEEALAEDEMSYQEAETREWLKKDGIEL